jgi:hypothetical protein
VRQLDRGCLTRASLERRARTSTSCHFGPWTTCTKFLSEINRTNTVLYFYGFDGNKAGPHSIVDCLSFDHVAQSRVEHIQLVAPVTGIKHFNQTAFGDLVNILPQLRVIRYEATFSEEP